MSDQEPHSEDEFHTSQKWNRRRFVGGLGAALFGFVPLAKSLIAPGSALAWLCHHEDVYCRLDHVDRSGCPTICVYRCYDHDTGNFCWSRRDPC
jgi:hypothetical protein